MQEMINKFIGGVKHFAEGREWASFALITLLGLIISWIIKKQLTAYLRGRFVKSEGGLRVKILHAFGAPISILIFGYFFLLAFDQFKNMPGSLWQRAHDLYPILNIAAIFIFALRFVDVGVELFRRRFTTDETDLDESWCRLISILGKITVSSLGLIFAIQSMGISVIPLITGASFLGAGFALAAQSTIANMIGSFEIMVDRLFKEGDRISFCEYDGFVTKMGLRSIQLTALTGEKISLPNKDLVDKQIRNFTKKNKVSTSFTIGLTYGHTRKQIEQATFLLKEIVGSHPRVNGEVQVNFRSLGSYTLDLFVCCWADYKNGLEYTCMLNDFNLAIKDRFDAAGLVFAFPTTTVEFQGAPPSTALTSNNNAP